VFSVNAQTRATITGAVAVLLWSSLAPLTVSAHDIPPLQLLATTFGIAFLCGLSWVALVGGVPALKRLCQPFGYFAFTVAALFGYHALYFTALTLAPAPQASLVAYLWPLLMVLFAASSAGEQGVRLAHILGGVLGLTGTALLLFADEGHRISWPHRTVGLLAALGCALTWSTYSVANKRFREVPTQAMVIVCGIVAIMGLLAHRLIGEPTVAPQAPQWLAAVALGIGPMGLAFFAWDYGTKQGNTSLLGTLSYGAPVLSTLLLVLLGRAPASPELLVACALVTAGAWVATRGASLSRISRYAD
jgi:drug/metabolite transporter (DMT)-like permease